MYKRFITYLILILSLFFIGAKPIENNIQQPTLYLDFGLYDFPNNTYPNTTTAYQLYVTREYVSDYENSISYVKYMYKYKIVGVSHSKYYGNVRNTYMEGFQIFWNKSPYPLNTHPLSLYIAKQGSVLYEIKTNDTQPHIQIKWSSSYYDARN